MAAVEQSDKIQSILALIGELSDAEQNTLYRAALDSHMADPFHNITTCELCKRQDIEHSDSDVMCCQCGFKERYDEENRFESFKCIVCSTVFHSCGECIDASRIIKPFECHASNCAIDDDVCVCNWCAIKCPEYIECPVGSPCIDQRCKAIQNKYYQSLTKCATKERRSEEMGSL